LYHHPTAAELQNYGKFSSFEKGHTVEVASGLLYLGEFEDGGLP